MSQDIQMIECDDGLPKRIRRAREFRGMKQSDLARLCKIPASSISHFEAGSRSPSWASFRSICYALGVDSEYLICRSDHLVRMVSNEIDEKLRKLNQRDVDVVMRIIEGLGDRK